MSPGRKSKVRDPNPQWSSVRAHCPNCGARVFTARQRPAAFCASCGAPLNRRPKAAQSQVDWHECFGCGRRFNADEWRRTKRCPECGRDFRRCKGRETHHRSATRIPDGVRPMRIDGSRRQDVARRVQAVAKEAALAAVAHPFPAAAGAGLAGFGLIVCGHAVSAVGSGVATAGGVIACLGMLGALVAGAGGDVSDGPLQGMKVGMGLWAAGVGAVVAGQIATCGGYAAVAGAAGLAGYGIWKHARPETSASAHGGMLLPGSLPERQGADRRGGRKP